MRFIVSLLVAGMLAFPALACELSLEELDATVKSESIYAVEETLSGEVKDHFLERFRRYVSHEDVDFFVVISNSRDKERIMLAAVKDQCVVRLGLLNRKDYIHLRGEDDRKS